MSVTISKSYGVRGLPSFWVGSRRVWVHCIIERIVKVDPLVNAVINEKENKRKGLIDPLYLELNLDLVDGSDGMSKIVNDRTFMQRLKSFYFRFRPFSCL